MPIEIKELHIRVAVNVSASQPSKGAVSAGPGGDRAEKDGQGAIVAECVEQVLGILEGKRER